MHIFYFPDIIKDYFYLSPEESKHCINVLRLKKGELINVIDGRGKNYFCELLDENQKKCSLKIIDVQSSEKRKKYELTIAIAPTKNNERFEIFLEKSTEIGIDKIIPIICRYSERKVINKERFNKVLISAIKQSKSLFIPNISEITDFKSLIIKDFDGLKMIAHCYESEHKVHIKNLYYQGQNALILIGPEGDFSEEEVKLAVSKGFKEISISDSRLRTETAGIAICQIIDFINTP